MTSWSSRWWQLCVYRVSQSLEMIIFVYFFQWMFLHYHTDWLGSVKDLASEADEYFKGIKGMNISWLQIF